jgi:hypothetical protein
MYGFVNRSGELVVPCRFNEVSEFSHGLAAARESMVSKIGFIDGTGGYRIRPQFALANSFSEGLAAVLYQTSTGELGRNGYIRTDGTQAIADRFSLAYSFSEGLAAVAEDDAGEVLGFIEDSGAYRLSPRFRGADVRFSEGLAAVWQEERGFGYVDHNGQIVIQYQFYFADHFADGLALVGLKLKGETLYGFVNQAGEFTIEPRFTSASGFDGGLAWFSIGQQTGYISVNGETVWIDS